MSKTAHILAVDAERIPANFEATGFHQAGAASLEALTEAGLFIGPRPLLENDERFRQIIPYVVVTAPNGHILTYVRGASGNEARLHGKLSIGAGGHIDLSDIKLHADGSIDLATTIAASAGRELQEELGLMGYRVTWLGLLADNEDAVGRVHIGVVGVVNLGHQSQVRTFEDTLENVIFMTLEELSAAQDRLEGWTRLLIGDLMVTHQSQEQQKAT